MNYKRWRSYCPQCKKAEYPVSIGQGVRHSSQAAIVLELYRRSGGKLEEIEALVRGDGAPFIHGFHSKYALLLCSSIMLFYYALLCRYILDYYHLCRKVRDRLWAVYDREKRFREVYQKLMDYLNSGEALLNTYRISPPDSAEGIKRNSSGNLLAI